MQNDLKQIMGIGKIWVYDKIESANKLINFMKHRIDEKKIVRALAFCMLLIIIAYFSGKMLGRYIKNVEKENISNQKIIDNNSRS